MSNRIIHKPIIALDQGTSSTRALLIAADGTLIAKTQQTLPLVYPQNGWVEQDPDIIWQSVINTIKQLLEENSISASDIAGMGISNQRETTLLWDKKTGKTLYPAIVWQDRRTHDDCQQLQHYEAMVQQKTGLLLDPYFSATKLVWLLRHIPDAYARAKAGELAFGTVDSFLLWRLTQGKVHATDITNASRTLLFNLHTLSWDEELLTLFNIPSTLLPTVKPNQHLFGHTHNDLWGASIPIVGMMGDQQAAALGQGCMHSGDLKSTYGTGCFMLMHTGTHIVSSKHRLLTTINYQLHDKLAYGLEGSLFVAGATMQWLKDAVQMIHQTGDSAALASSVSDNGGVYLVPAFTGLGAPYWDPLARGAILGLTRDSRSAHIVRAALEACAYQTRDLLDAMHDDGCDIKHIRVDGGMAHNDWLMQFLADMLNIPVTRPRQVETSALGVAYLAGLTLGYYTFEQGLPAAWHDEQVFTPALDPALREQWYQGWREALLKILSTPQ